MVESTAFTRESHIGRSEGILVDFCILLTVQNRSSVHFTIMFRQRECLFPTSLTSGRTSSTHIDGVKGVSLVPLKPKCVLNMALVRIFVHIVLAVLSIFSIFCYTFLACSCVVVAPPPCTADFVHDVKALPKARGTLTRFPSASSGRTTPNARNIGTPILLGMGSSTVRSCFARWGLTTARVFLWTISAGW